MGRHDIDIDIDIRVPRIFISGLAGGWEMKLRLDVVDARHKWRGVWGRTGRRGEVS